MKNISNEIFRIKFYICLININPSIDNHSQIFYLRMLYVFKESVLKKQTQKFVYKNIIYQVTNNQSLY